MIFFLFRFIFKGISYIKLKAISNLIVVRSLIFEGIYFIKFKWISCFVMGSGPGRTVQQKGSLFFSF